MNWRGVSKTIVVLGEQPELSLGELVDASRLERAWCRNWWKWVADSGQRGGRGLTTGFSRHEALIFCAAPPACARPLNSTPKASSWRLPTRRKFAGLKVRSGACVACWGSEWRQRTMQHRTDRTQQLRFARPLPGHRA